MHVLLVAKNGILLLLLYCYIIIISVVHGRFAVTATAAGAAADRSSFILIGPSAVVAVVWMLMVCNLYLFCVLNSITRMI